MTPTTPTTPLTPLIPGLLLQDVELLGGRRTDVRLAHGTVVELGRLTRLAGERAVDCAGGALSVGLADHHLHLLAMAAAAESLQLSPAAAGDRTAVAEALASAGADHTGWIRAVGYADQAGQLPLEWLDRLHPSTPLRIQHRSGARWTLNSAALAAIGLADVPDGELWRSDSWLAGRLPEGPAPDLARLGRELASYGITAVTDATAQLPGRSLALLAAAATDGRLPQRILLLGTGPAEGLQGGLPGRITVGPRKILLSDHALPSFEDVSEQVRAAREDNRAVAVHCVTRESLALIIAVLDDVGVHPRDRIEHASLVSEGAIAPLRKLGLTVVTQPGFITDRGDHYRRALSPADLADLYRAESLRTAGVPVVCSSDAPYGPADPWRVVRAAAERRAPDGEMIGPAERMSVARALRGYLSAPLRPAGPPRRVGLGAPADLVLMHAPWAQVLSMPSREFVRATIIGGVIVGGVLEQ